MNAWLVTALRPAGPLLQGVVTRPLSDMQSALFTLVFLSSGSLPWMAAAQRGDKALSLTSTFVCMYACMYVSVALSQLTSSVGVGPLSVGVH